VCGSQTRMTRRRPAAVLTLEQLWVIACPAAELLEARDKSVSAGRAAARREFTAARCGCRTATPRSGRCLAGQGRVASDAYVGVSESVTCTWRGERRQCSRSLPVNSS
jgi:hypothetical protein